MSNKTNTVYAEQLNFWQTGRGSPDDWIERAKRQIEELGGSIVAEAFGKDVTGRAAYMLRFAIGADQFHMVWPVLASKSKNATAEKRQAATMLYHAVKARCLEAVIRGPRVAFAADLVLPDGRTMGQLSAPELMRALPLMIAAPVRSED